MLQRITAATAQFSTDADLARALRAYNYLTDILTSGDEAAIETANGALKLISSRAVRVAAKPAA